jgi:hypothetical protein
METYLEVMAYWNTKTLEQKAKTLGEDILDKWFESIARSEFLTPAESMTK